jgi:ribose transport system ATP-binding protein
MTSEILLEMRGITKDFPGVRALDSVDIDLRGGEILALLGENGAGKSTLMRILFGAYPKDSGQIFVRGHEVVIRNPHHALQQGISMVHQELNLVPYMNAAQNIALGHESRRLGSFLRWNAIYRDAQAQLDRLGVKLDLKAPVNRLSVAQQQMVEIAKALSWDAQVLVLDEPTSALTPHEIKQLWVQMKNLAAQGVGIILITHRLEEVFDIAGRATVLRDGHLVGSWAVNDVDMSQLVQAMVGRTIDHLFPKSATERGEELLRVKGLARTAVLDDVSFSAYQGEILGIAGLVGAGRTELARAIFGADPVDKGTLYVRGKPIVIHSPEDAIGHGIGFLTEDRKTQGLVLVMTVESNMALTVYDRLSRFTVINKQERRKLGARYIEQLRVRPPQLDRQVRHLSGGNQQKVVLGKWLAREAGIFIFDEPTRGIDVGAKGEVHQLMSNLAQAGACVIMISSELPEVLNMSDRILVMREGRLVAELSRQEATQELVMEYATGVRAPQAEAAVTGGERQS